MKNIQIIDRKTGKETFEKVLGEKALAFLYKDFFLSKIFLFLICKNIFFSKFYGFLQRRKFSKKKIKPFLREYEINIDEIEKNIESFSSFNDFFIRKLKPEFRPISSGESIAVLPADARYMVFQDIHISDGFYVKGKVFDLKTFLQDDNLAKRYSSGSMVIARLCPTDYHRFHFPFDCFASNTRLINGYLYSVNPIAIRKNIDIFSQNKRMITPLYSEKFKEVLFIEIGATNVGTIHQTYSPENFYKKGDEKGYFSFGGSTIILLFEKNTICFAKDMILNSKNKIETKANFGEVLGVSM